jgi:hypothetical protein
MHNHGTNSLTWCRNKYLLDESKQPDGAQNVSISISLYTYNMNLTNCLSLVTNYIYILVNLKTLLFRATYRSI